MAACPTQDSQNGELIWNQKLPFRVTYLSKRAYRIPQSPSNRQRHISTLSRSGHMYSGPMATKMGSIDTNERRGIPVTHPERAPGLILRLIQTSQFSVKISEKLLSKNTKIWQQKHQEITQISNDF